MCFVQALGKAVRVVGEIDELCKQQEVLADIDDANDSLKASTKAVTVILHEFHVRRQLHGSCRCLSQSNNTLVVVYNSKEKLASLSWTEDKAQFLLVQAMLTDKAASLQELSAMSCRVERAKNKTLNQIEQLKASVLIKLGCVQCVKSIHLTTRCQPRAQHYDLQPTQV